MKACSISPWNLPFNSLRYGSYHSDTVWMLVPSYTASPGPPLSSSCSSHKSEDHHPQSIRTDHLSTTPFIIMLCKSQTISLLLISAALGLGGYTAVVATVCYPAYIPGSIYAVGAWVSKSITTTSPILYTACTPGVGTCPPSGFLTEGGNSTTATYNYQCKSNDWCSNIGFAPGSIYSDIAWTKETPACVGTAICAYNYDGSCGSTTAPGAPFTGDCKYVKVVTTTPTPTPTVIDISPWTASTTYTTGDKVRIGGDTFQCKPAPFNAYCNLATYQPSLSSNGLWIDAWTSSGPCQYASLAPTSGP